MRYRRTFIPGGTYFFTAVIENRQSNLLTDHVDQLRAATLETRHRFPFHIIAAVVMPDHLHMIWQLPEGDSDYVTRWRLLKTLFTQSLPQRIRENGKSPWQRRYWEHCIRNEDDLDRHIDYIHINPVKHGYVDMAADWAFSSIHGYIKRGDMPRDWGCTLDLFEFDR